MPLINEIGERDLVRRIQEISQEKGKFKLVLDDAAPVDIEAGTLWVTTDPSPIPNLVQIIGLGSYFHAGWLCVVKSLSDVAAVGATPLGIVVALELQADTTLKDFDAFFEGAVICAAQHGCPLLGGNIRETKSRPHALSFAIGRTVGPQHLLRGRVTPGSKLYVVKKEELGSFWAGVATHVMSESCSSLAPSIIKTVQNFALMPTAKLSTGIALREKIHPSFCMDTSDGLLACAFELAHCNDVDIHLNIRTETMAKSVQRVAEACGADARLWALGWGEYQLFFVAEPDTNPFEAVMDDSSSEILEIGEIRRGTGLVYFNIDNKERLVEKSALQCEQFRYDSIWETGINSYMDFMLSKNLESLTIE